MPFIPVPGCAMVEVRMLRADQHIENTLYVHNDDNWDGASLLALAGNIRDWWDGAMSPLISTEVSINEIVATGITQVDDFQATLDGGGVAGARGGDTLPNNVSFAVAFHTGIRGRSFRGRNYLPAICADDRSATNSLDDGYVSDVIAAYGGLLTAVLPSGQTWVVVSRFADNEPRVTGISTQVISVGATDNIIDSMRRRLPGRGA